MRQSDPVCTGMITVACSGMLTIACATVISNDLSEFCEDPSLVGAEEEEEEEGANDSNPMCTLQ